jgi:uncharacterized protein with NRDE domain
MCLLVLAWQSHPRYRLVVAANRDEFHARAAAALAPWPAPEDILAGRDLRAHGTWLALDRRRRFGVVTNFRELQPPRTGAPSRGELIPAYLRGSAGAQAFCAALAACAAEYSGFNLLLADGESLCYASNRATPFARALPPGIYGLANERLDTPWPKLARVRAGFERWLQEDGADPEGLLALLADRSPALDTTEPAGGLPREWARALSAPFVLHPEYGTRCSTVLLLGADGQLKLTERRFDAHGERSGQSAFVLGPSEWPRDGTGAR